VAQGRQRDRRVRHVELERGAGFLGHQGQVDLAVAGQGEGQHVGVARQTAAKRPWWLAEDQVHPLPGGGHPLAGA
jgi:hypothetical protein